MTQDGEITIRDQKLIALQDRNTVKSLVASENRDRGALYAEIAKANEHPEWEADIREIFARRWVDNAPSGWWYQDCAGWLETEIIGTPRSKRGVFPSDTGPYEYLRL